LIRIFFNEETVFCLVESSGIVRIVTKKIEIVRLKVRILVLLQSFSILGKKFMFSQNQEEITLKTVGSTFN
jgi:hypothetical protein